MKQLMSVPAFGNEVNAYYHTTEEVMTNLNARMEPGAQTGNMILDQAAQIAAVKLASQYISPMAGSALKKANALLGILDPFPSSAEAPTLPETDSDSPCQ